MRLTQRDSGQKAAAGWPAVVPACVWFPLSSSGSHWPRPAHPPPLSTSLSLLWSPHGFSSTSRLLHGVGSVLVIKPAFYRFIFSFPISSFSWRVFPFFCFVLVCLSASHMWTHDVFGKRKQPRNSDVWQKWNWKLEKHTSSVCLCFPVPPPPRKRCRCFVSPYCWSVHITGLSVSEKHGMLYICAIFVLKWFEVWQTLLTSNMEAADPPWSSLGSHIHNPHYPGFIPDVYKSIKIRQNI